MVAVAMHKLVAKVAGGHSLDLTAVPEPSTGLLALAATGLLAQRRRRL